MSSTITAEQLAQLCCDGQKVDLIDVRTPVEFREVHVEFARNIPLDQLSSQAVTAQRCCSSDQPIYVVCRSGARGKTACEQLAAAGLKVINVDGGTLACVAAGLPVVRGKKAIALDRQVRMIAGSLVVIGCAIGYFVHPLGIALAGFIGAGIAFAGLTDWCPMAITLGRMPWNQVRDQSGSAGAASGSCCTG